MKTRIGGAEIAYDDRGRGRPLLFIHAFPLGLSMWDPQAEALASAFRVIRFDVRGFGGSPPRDEPLTMDRIADDAAGLLDHLELTAAVVCGLSMGGYAALAFSRRYAHRLDRLVLADTKAGPDSDSARRDRHDLAVKVRFDGPRAAADVLTPKLVGETTLKERPELISRIRRIILANSPAGIAAALEALASRPDSAPSLAAIRAPTLVVCGSEDVLTPLAESEALHRAIPESRLEVIPRAGHLSNLENPPAFNTALSQFLESAG